MNHNQPHEPETKGFNKTRDFQDRLLRLMKDGVQNNTEAAPYLKEWFLDASDPVQDAFMSWAAGYWWSIVELKMERREGFNEEMAEQQQKEVIHVHRHEPILSPERKAKIEEQVFEGMHKQWVVIISNLTGSQVRAAKMLPDEMAAQVADDQKVGEVFTNEQLMQVKQV